MGNVARLAAFDTYRGVLIEERPPLIDVAFQTWLFITYGLIYHSRPSCHVPGSRERSMGIVTIGAFDRSFVDAMLEGHRELCSHSCMTPVTSVALLSSFQEVFRGGRAMNGMAICADNIG